MREKLTLEHEIVLLAERRLPLRVQWWRRRWDRLCLGLLILYAVAVGLVRAYGRAFWYDEIFSLAVVREEHAFGGLWNTLKLCVDSNPPGFHLLQMLFDVRAPDEHVALRVAPLLGFALTSVCLFFFVRKRCGAPSALLAALAPFLTQLFSDHAIDARPYSLTCGFLALAMVAWQHSDRTLGAVIFPLSLGAAASMHHYAVFGLGPFLAAEG